MKRPGDELIVSQTPQSAEKKLKIDLTEEGEEKKGEDYDIELEKAIQELIDEGVPKIPEPVKLSKSQQEAKDMALKGYNLFITGNAGSGKSTLLDTIEKELDKMKKSYVVTASTGIAAWNIGGITTHSFAGMGLADKDIEYYTRGLKYKADKI
jgi:DNA replication protein DnaC